MGGVGGWWELVGEGNWERKFQAGGRAVRGETTVNDSGLGGD